MLPVVDFFQIVGSLFEDLVDLQIVNYHVYCTILRYFYLINTREYGKNESAKNCFQFSVLNIFK